MLPSFQHQGISAYRPTHFFRAKKGTSIESSQILGVFATVVYTNSPSLYSKKKGMRAKEIELRAIFWIKDQFILKMGGGDRYQIPDRHQIPTKKDCRESDRP